MSPEIQEWSHKSRSRINNLYLLNLLTRPIASLSITVLLYNGPLLQAVGYWTSATKFKKLLVGKWHIMDGKCLYVQSNGIGHTRYLAEQHSREAVRQIQQLEPSVERDALISATQRVINRLK